VAIAKSHAWANPPGPPSLEVLDEAAIPSIFWKASEPRLYRQALLAEFKGGLEIEEVALSNPEPVQGVRVP
jgi:hypothetical protein